MKELKLVQKEIPKELASLGEDLEEIQKKILDSILQDILEQERELFSLALKVKAKPPIKGEITYGKIKWRGIRVCRQLDGFDQLSWLEQRGEKISPIFKVKGSIMSDPFSEEKEKSNKTNKL